MMAAGVKRSLLAVTSQHPFILEPVCTCFTGSYRSDVIVVKATEMSGEAVAVVRMTGLGYALQAV